MNQPVDAETTLYVVSASVADCFDAETTLYVVSASVASCFDAETTLYVVSASVAGCFDAETTLYVVSASAPTTSVDSVIRVICLRCSWSNSKFIVTNPDNAIS